MKRIFGRITDRIVVRENSIAFGDAYLPAGSIVVIACDIEASEIAFVKHFSVVLEHLKPPRRQYETWKCKFQNPGISILVKNKPISDFPCGANCELLVEDH